MRVPGVPRWCGGHHPVGDTKSGPIRLTFNPQLRVEFRGATVTSDAGLLLPRELDDQLGLDALIEHHLSDPRTGHNRQFPLRDLFRQSIYSRLAGYEDTNDAERLAEDPTFRMLASRERRETRSPASRVTLDIDSSESPVHGAQEAESGSPRNLRNQRRWCRENDPCHGARLARLGREALRASLSSARGKRTWSISEIPVYVAY